ncbi:MAG: rRNA (guanine1207-N2)-methyltransferase [Thermoleophilaceae bacterium]|nr:rRNA (guanine1207-N2)-methyltransferase [Thermoleophilaceae bacterium]
MIRFEADGEGVAFHELAAGRASLPEGVEHIELAPPAYRGKRLLPVLSWLATQHAPGARATWRVERRFGPDYVRRALEPYGWRLEPERAARWLLLHGDVPAPHELPPPRSFSAHGLRFEADFGVFSPERIDPGSEFLLEVVGARPDRVEKVADIGTGYGALALSLVTGGRAGRALATEVDSISAWLAERNAQAAGVDMRVELDPDPLAFGPTPLTVCNVPTHVDAVRTAAMMEALVERARHGRLVFVVHAALADRYARYLRALRVKRHTSGEHVVFEALAR